MSLFEVRATQVVAAVAGAVLLIVSLVMWSQPDPPSGRTVSKTTSATTPTRGAAAGGTAHSSYVVETTATVDGTAPQGRHLEPLDHASRRSEPLTLELAGGALLLLLVALLFPRLRGASGAGAALTLDPISLTRRRARERRAADSRLPQNLEELAADLLQARIDAWKSDTVPLDALIDESITAFVDRPTIRDGSERYRGDYVVAETSSGTLSPIGRILFYPSEGARFDVIRAGSDVNWGSEGSQKTTARQILRHASGNRHPPDPVVEQFVTAHPQLFVAGKPWSLPLAEVLNWIDAHWDLDAERHPNTEQR